MFFLQSYPQETNPDKAVEKKKTARPNRGQGLDKVVVKINADKQDRQTRTRPGQGAAKQSLNKDNALPTAAQQTRPGQAPDMVSKKARGVATAASWFLI